MSNSLVNSAGCGLVVFALLATVGCDSDSSATSVTDGPSSTASDSRARDNAPLRDDDPRPVDERLAEVEEFGRQGNFEDALTVVHSLDDASPHVRRAAQVAAERIVGYGVPVNPYWPPEKLRKAQSDYERMLKLADELGVEHFVDTVPALIDRMEDESVEVRRQAYADVKRTTGIGYGFRADGPPEQRERIVNAYRKLWNHWNRADSKALALLRDPDLRAEHKRASVAEMTTKP